MNFDFTNWLTELLINKLGVNVINAIYLKTVILFIGLMVFCFFIWKASRKLLNYIVPKVIAKTTTLWDDIILNQKVIRSVSHLLPVIAVNYFAPFIFVDIPFAIPFIKGFTDVLIILVATEILSSFLNSAKEIFSQSKKYRDKPIGSFTQLGKIAVYSVAIILIISIVIGKNPLYLLSGLGAMAAILLLVFKDSIMGFVASIQLSANDMVRIGDWVTVPKYGADGDVFEINLTTIKVRNFDKTITTIPTYTFISDSFTNWRGMEEANGRRIKRAINIKIDSIKFCSDEMLTKFKKYHIISDYIAQKEAEIITYNKEKDIDKSALINGRHLTNIGVYRVYIEAYLKHNADINKEMTCMVRQLPSNEYGLPIEIYAFSKDKNWVTYEAVLANLFDHLFAATHDFELEIFERPSGGDFRGSS